MTKAATKAAMKAAMKAEGRKLIKDPNKPKGPTTAFMYFFGDMRKTLKKEQPDLAFEAVAKVCIFNIWVHYFCPYSVSIFSVKVSR